MEITRIQVKTVTLSKSLLGQIEATRKWSDNCVKGWINTGTEIYLIVEDGDFLRKVRQTAMWDELGKRDDAPEYSSEMKKYVEDFYHKFPQIFT